ncbi:ABC transporter substrate-binding protein [Aquibacillus rhizosphaerae]|uniref:ABC transporter substrate-binding protein n=1 Tax=Aquibacillus rhizosphaerae TaxID=3051431 RepID=A0ABT7L9J7_9BACI|nr:ABC transporter substrate-binding protein [Aquibacillus sp. LR5S19]MDL4842528.1 ABC transporter substrate-binding protein [Aquibacillus sp. LR5S19]
MYKTKRTVFIFLILLISLIVLTACNKASSSSGDEETSKEDTKEASTEPVELTIAARAGSMADALTEVVKQYEEETGNKVNVNAMPYDNLKETVVLDVRNNSGAFDLVMIDDPWMPEFAEGELLTNLDSYFPDGLASDFVQKSAALGKVPYETGSTYAVPFIGNVQMFFYRNDLVEKYDIDAPQTWDDVLAFAETIKDEEQETFGYALRGQRGNPIVSNYLPLFWAYGGTVLDENMKPQVNTEAGVKAMEMYMKLKETGPKGVETFDSDQIATSLTQGQVAMTIAWPSWVSEVDNKENSNVVGKVNFSAVPSQESDAAAMIGNWLLGIPRTSQNTDAAAAFLEWVTSAETQKEMTILGAGAPTRVSVYEDPELVEQYRHFPAQLEALQNSVARPRTSKWSQVEDTWGMYLSQILAGQLDIQEGLDKANEELEGILAK